jgi:hypothetical protein
MVEQAPMGAWSTFTNTNWFEERSVKAGRENRPINSEKRTGSSSLVKNPDEMQIPNLW